jgi:hypothetical protein
VKKFATLLLLAGFAGGCLPFEKQPETSTDEVKKESNLDENSARQIAPILPESLNEYNAKQKAQALEDEIKRDAQNPPKVIVEARK